jgi:hypothetical protein
MVCVLALLALAGCAAPAPAAEPEVAAPATAPAPAAWRQVYLDEGSLGADALSWVAGNVNPQSHNWTLPFEVTPQATGLVAELDWDDDASDLDLQVASHIGCPERSTPDFVACVLDEYVLDGDGSGSWRKDDGMPGDGDSPVVIVLSEDDLHLYPCKQDSCDWATHVWAKATPGTGFRIAVTVFYGEAPPAGYTALA